MDTPVSKPAGVILVVEDDDGKFSDICQTLAEIQELTTSSIQRARNVVEAEAALDSYRPRLLILDISLNISPGSLGPLRGGFANLGGLNIAERMYMYGKSLPTVVLTGFDYFHSEGTRLGSFDMVSLVDIERKAKEFFGRDLIGCVRYSSPTWRADLTGHISRGLKP